MKVKRINRVVIVVGNLDEAMAMYTKILDATFTISPKEFEQVGRIRYALSFDAGLELIQLLDGEPERSSDPNEHAMLQWLRNDGYRWLKQRGEGIAGVVFDIDDVEESRQAAESLGIGIPYTFEFSEQELAFFGISQYTKYLEYYADPDKANNTMTLLSEFVER